MGLSVFLVSAIILSILVMLFRNRTITLILMFLFSLLHIGFTIYAWSNLEKTELTYFTFNHPGVLLLSVLSLLIIPVVYHGFLYVASDDTRKSAIYHASLIALIAFMTGAYLANNMTVLWIFTEATALELQR